MTRLDEARALLEALGMPPSQRNENAVYTLLGFANIGPDDPWSEASAVRRNPHDIITFAQRAWQKQYAENTRETIRRQAIHQFVQGGILLRNPDDPSLSTNSPRTHYALSDAALSVLRAWGQPDFDAVAQAFRAAAEGGLALRYARQREDARVPVTLPDGRQFQLSPGKHNMLQALIIEEFLPRFAGGARVLYLGDSARKHLVVDHAQLQALGIPVSEHDKLPDVVAWMPDRNWLFLAEAVTSHGPVSAKRQVELEEMLAGCSAGKVYVSAFLSFAEFKRHADQIAWDTEVWIAEAPSHLLHYNGDRFYGPR